MSVEPIYLQPETDALPGDVGPSFNITEYMQLLLTRWPLILAITLLGGIAGLGHYYMTPKLYRASTIIQIEKQLASGLNSLNPWLEEWTSRKYYPTQYWLLKSRGLAERAVLDLRLMEDESFFSGARRPEEPDVSAAEDLNIVDENLLAGLGRKISGNLSVKPIEGTEMVQLTFVSSNAELAAKIVNGVASTYIEWGIEKRNTTIGRATSFMEQQIETLKLQIEDKEQQLQQYSREADIINLDPDSNTSLALLEQLNRSLTLSIASRLEKEAEYRTLLAASPDNVVDRESSPLVNELRRELAAMERDYSRKLETYKPSWPEMVDLQSEIDRNQQDLAAVTSDEADKIRRKAYAEFQAGLRHERSLETQIEQTKEEAFSVGSAALEYRNLVMEISNRRDLLDGLLKQQSEAGVSVRLQGPSRSNVRIVDRALVPGSAFRPSLRNDLTTGLAVSFALGIGLVLLIHFLDRTIKSPAELERLLRIPVLAVIPDVSSSGKGGRYGYYSYYSYGRSRGKDKNGRAATGKADEKLEIELLPDRRPKIGVSEAYRSLRTALLLSSAEALKIVTITSAGAGEGKTATASNLAVVMAQLGKRVLIVDADLRKPRVHKVFSLTNRLGLVNYLTTGAQPEEIFQPSGIDNLTVCPCGPHPPNPSELLASDKLADFMDYVRNKFDFVVVDSPPVLAVTDAILAGSITDGVVICSRAHKVQRDEARTCVDQLRLADVRLLGTVLNAFRPIRSGYYDRKYYYYYESYSDEGEQAGAESTAADSAA